MGDPLDLVDEVLEMVAAPPPHPPGRGKENRLLDLLSGPREHTLRRTFYSPSPNLRGSHRRDSVSRAVVGSVAATVADHSRCDFASARRALSIWHWPAFLLGDISS